ncbi:MAG: hypothetical protein ABS76_29520 [Pelagibacterium sp. SCN 64-44]|nr:MAG: hypothetical protein ABS76_29520 [Pelagibacterium sp. SCN 64-44]
MHSSTVNGLLTFLEVAELGSINRAAAQLNLSQSSVTRAIKLLEARLGAEVFVRSAKGVELTPFGANLLGNARAVRAEVQRTELTILDLRQAGERELHIGVVMVHPLMPFCRALMATLASRAGLRLKLTFGMPDEIIAMLREGKVEIALSYLLEGAAAGGVRQDFLVVDDIGFYCAPDHPLAARKLVSLDDLLLADWTLGGSDCAVGNRVREHFSAQGLTLVKPCIEVELTPLRRTLVVHSHLVSAFLLHHVETELRSGALVRIRYDWPQERRALGAIRLGRHTPATSALVHALREAYA